MNTSEILHLALDFFAAESDSRFAFGLLLGKM